MLVSRWIVSAFVAMAMALSVSAAPAAADASPSPAVPSGHIPATQPAGPTTPPSAEGVEEISLERVWAVRMPGTKPMEITHTGDGKGFANLESAVLSEILNHLPHFGMDIRGGFAVNGMDRDALAAAHARIVDEQPPASLVLQHPIGLVFFSHQQGMDIHVQRVWQKGTHVEVHYVKVPRGDEEFRAQLAIIPLNTLPGTSGMPASPGTPVSPTSLKIILRGQLLPSDPRLPGFANDATLWQADASADETVKPDLSDGAMGVTKT